MKLCLLTGDVNVKYLKYKSPPFTTIDGITAILNDVKAFAPASVYTMIIGCHGMGWLPVYEMKVRSAPHMKCIGNIRVFH